MDNLMKFSAALLAAICVGYASGSSHYGVATFAVCVLIADPIRKRS